MTLETLFRQTLLPFRQHLVVARGVFLSSIRVLLYLAALPLISYSFMYIYIGDGSIETIMAMPQPIALSIFLLNVITFMILIPFVMVIAKHFVFNKSYHAGDMLRMVRGRIRSLVLGFITLGGAGILLFALVFAAVPYFSTPTAFSLFSLLVFALSMYVYLNVLFWSHFVVLSHTSTWQGFAQSRKLFRTYGKIIFSYALMVAFLSMLFLNGVSLIFSALITNATASSIALAFVQSLVLIYSQIVLSSIFLNLTLFVKNADPASPEQSEKHPGQ